MEKILEMLKAIYTVVKGLLARFGFILDDEDVDPGFNV